jgi:hypothetical protein
MDQMIVVVLAIGALCWGLRVMPWKPVTARARVAQGFSLRVCGHGADWVVERNRPMKRAAAGPDG